MAAPQNPKNKTQKPNPAATPKQPQPALTSTNTYLPDWTTDWKIYLILILFATGLYLNTVPNKYAFDDSISVTENTFTKEGISGIGKILSTDYLMGMWGREMKMYAGGRYRPLSLVSLAIEYEFFGENPHVSHLVNALLYGLTAFLLFLVLSKLFVRHPWGIGKDNPWYLGLPFIITLLFIAHPLHTEVVANIKGRDEIMTLLGVLAAWYYSLRYAETSKPKYLLLSGVYMFLGLMSKESAITFLAVIPLSLYVFYATPRKQLIWATAPILVASLIFLRIRFAILGGLPNNDIPATYLTDSFLGLDTAQRFATIFYTYLRYLFLLFFPHPLTYDYYPYHIPVKKFSDIAVIASIAIHAILLIVAIIRLRARSLFAFGVLYFWITFSVVSNLFFSIGVFMSERFVYAPSLGFIIALVCSVAYFAEKFLGKGKAAQWIVGGFLLMTLGFSIKTFARNFDWKDSYTLFTTDVKVSSNSIKSTSGAGELLLFKARKTTDPTEKKLYYDLAIEYFTTTLRIFPDYIYVIQYMGDAQVERYGDIANGMKYYTQVLKYRPDYTDTYGRIVRIFDQVSLQNYSVDARIAVLENIRNLSAETAARFEINLLLGRLYGPGKNNIPKAIMHFELADKAQPNNPELLADLGVAYSMAGRLPDARNVLERAVKLKPDLKSSWDVLAQVYKALGLNDLAKNAAEKAK